MRKISLSRVVVILGYVFLIVGVISGWGPLVMHSPNDLPFTTVFSSRIPLSVDASNFLSAIITSLSVLIAILIGYNIAAIQIVGQLHSIAFMRITLLSSIGLFFWWIVATGVAIYYLLSPPLYFGQLWQIFFWFVAIVLFIVAYLLNLPWYLSSEYVIASSIRNIQKTALRYWEDTPGYTTIQSAFVSAIARADLNAIRIMSYATGNFFVSIVDASAEQQPQYTRNSYRTLKNLLSGSLYVSSSIPNGIVYAFGFFVSGIFLQVTALGMLLPKDNSHLFSGVFRALNEIPDNIDALWAGMRNALFREGPQGTPFLVQYWQYRPHWDEQEPRTLDLVASGMIFFLILCQRELLKKLNEEQALEKLQEMIIDLYNYVGIHLKTALLQWQPHRVATHRHFAEALLEKLEASRIQQGVILTDAQEINIHQVYTQYNDPDILGHDRGGRKR